MREDSGSSSLKAAMKEGGGEVGVKGGISLEGVDWDRRRESRPRKGGVRRGEGALGLRS